MAEHNRAYIKTHERIKKVFSEIMEKKPVAQITVGEICEAIEINRSTFYAHFQDVYAVLEEIFVDHEMSLVDYYDELEKNNGRKLNEVDYMVGIFEHALDYKTLYKRVFEDTNTRVIELSMHSLRTNVVQQIYDYFKMEDRLATYAFDFTMHGFFAVFRRWLKDGCIESPQDMGNLILNLAATMPDGGSWLDILSSY